MRLTIHSIRMARALVWAVILAALPALAHQVQSDAVPGGVVLDHPWARATSPEQSNAAVYMQIHNSGDSDIVLHGGQSAIAERVEIHQSREENGLMTMVPLTEALVIPAGETLRLAPGGLHLMLFGVEGGLFEGEVFMVTLALESEDASGGAGREIELEVDIVVESALFEGIATEYDDATHQNH